MSESERLWARVEAIIMRLEGLLPVAAGEPLWGETCAFRWHRRGIAGALESVGHLSSIRLEDLQCIDAQKSRLESNTRQFLRGLPANHSLLWGPRGTGKSSLIKALFNNYASEGLRLVELGRDDVLDLPEIYDYLHRRPERFIVYCDDLSFESGEVGFKTLKVVLDGSITSAPDNALFYATSNRRHLMPEQLSENFGATRLGEEIHPTEAVEERISLSERFGLWLAFHPFSQEEYLRIVRYWLARFGVAIDAQESAGPEALRWALLRGSRSGRCAWQFARDWAGRRALQQLER